MTNTPPPLAQVIHADALTALAAMPDNSVDAIVTDPPYGLSFMGKKWDYDVPGTDLWAECLRVLKPGGHLLAFAGTRTQHRMAVRIEDAGFEIRDMIAWVYGSGFPKSLDVSKAIDKAAGALEHEGRAFAVAGRTDKNLPNPVAKGYVPPAPATPEAKQWQGWGTALKPALEPITLARKPLSGTVASNVLAWGTGALNVDGCRVPAEKPTGWGGGAAGGNTWNDTNMGLGKAGEARPVDGRWPANFIHDGDDEVVRLFPQAKGESAARFFYCSKASKRDRDAGLEAFEERMSGMSNGAQLHGEGYDKGQSIGLNKVIARKNHHPTVKPTDLMRYLCRLVTPTGGVVLDPFCGSGTTGVAALREGFRFIGIEREAEYVALAQARVRAVEVPFMEVKNV